MRAEGLGFPVSRIGRAPRAVSDLVDASVVRDHIARLESVGMSIAMIARAAGITDTQVSFYKSGQATTRKAYADAVLAVDGRPSKHQAYVLGVGSVRRLQGLARLGFTLEDIATEVGMSWSSLSRVRRSTGVVLWETHVAVRDAFDSFGIDGGSDIARRRAIRCGWVHPLLWDDIDDPFEEAPTGDVGTSDVADPVAVERLIAGVPVKANPEDRREAFLQLLDLGWSLSSAGNRVRINHATAVEYAMLRKVSA